MRVGGPLIRYDWCPYKKEAGIEDRDTQGGEDSRVTQRQRLEWDIDKLRKFKNCPKHQKPKLARQSPCLEASEGGWPCLHLDFRFLASRTMRV